MDKPLSPETLAVRAGQERSQFGEHAEALYLTSSYVFDSAAQAAARFAGEEAGNVYSRYTNPTVDMMQERLAALDGAEACVATASGMAAILTTVMGLMRAGEHIVASMSIFGSTQALFSNVLSRFGIETTFVDSADPARWAEAFKATTRLVFLETPSNPLTGIFDIAALAALAHRHGALLAVDNSFCSPVLQLPLQLGADLTIYSGTKSLDGQGRVLGGAVCGKRAHIEELIKFLRSGGPSISPFNAWVILKGMETLKLRMQAQSASALELARRLEAHPAVERVYYPGLASHPQHALALRQQKSGGAVLSFVVKGGRDAAWKVIDSTQILSITSNLGDVKTTITHPCTTTHGKVAPEVREATGIVEGLLRIAIGLEAVDDIEADLRRGLDTL